MIFVSTLVKIFASCLVFSWWMRCAAFATCLTWAMLEIGSVAIAFLVLEEIDFIYDCCCHNSTIRFVLVEVFYDYLVLLGMLEKGRVCNVLSPLLQSDPLLDFKMLHCMKKQLCSMYHFLSFQFGTGTILPDLLCVDLVDQLSLCSPCLMSLYISLMWFQYKVDTCRVSVMALNTALGFFWLSLSFEMGSVFHNLKPSLPRKPTIIANHISLSMLDAQKG